MRCYICDFSEGEAKSLYNFSLVDPKGSRKRTVLLVDGKEICTYCYEPVKKELFNG